jgi:hypothetical protein
MSNRVLRPALADAVGLLVVLLVLLDLLRPSLLLLPTIAAGGDTPCHYPTAAWFCERLLPHLRLHGWYPGAYLGHPLLLYYFPFPFLLMAVLAPASGLAVAFKLGTALGVFFLPFLVYGSFRLMRLAAPAPLLGAAAALVFLYVEDNPIWGGTIASTLTGEFSYTYAVGFAVLFLGALLRARAAGRGPWAPAAVLALTAYAHGYAVLWAGLTASSLLLWDPRPRRALLWLLALAGLAFAFAAPLLLPLLAGWGWTTPYDDAWIDITAHGLFPPLLLPLFVVGAAAIAIAFVRAWRGRPDPPLLLLAHGVLVGAALAAAGPVLGVIDVRFVPFAQLSLALAGAAALGVVLARLTLGPVAALGLLLLGVAVSDALSRVLRSWIDWNYSGLEAKELWPAWRELTTRLAGTVSDPRVAVEYSPVHERAGSIRMYETLPFFSGRSTLEGVYNQASTTTHPVYYLASELFATSPNPFRKRTYSRFDPQSALSRLRLFDVSEVVALSPQLVAFLDGRRDVEREATIAPYTVYRLLDPGPGYVEPVAFEPLRAPRRGWRDAAYRWFTRKPANRALIVFTDDERFRPLPDPWAALPERPLPAGVTVTSQLEAEAVHITTSRPGHPLLVKVSYHPRWRAEGADGPYLVAPGLMLVVPRQRDVRLTYTARDASDWGGYLLAAGALGLALAWQRRRRRAELTEEDAAPGRRERLAVRALGAAPLVLLLAMAAGRLVPPPDQTALAGELYDKASRAYAAGSFPDAAEYARGALGVLADDDSRREELLCLKGEALLRAGYPREAALDFAVVVSGGGAHRPQALFSGARAREAAGDAAGAAEWRRWLQQQYPRTPWAQRLAPP